MAIDKHVTQNKHEPPTPCITLNERRSVGSKQINER